MRMGAVRLCALGGSSALLLAFAASHADAGGSIAARATCAVAPETRTLTVTLSNEPGGNGIEVGRQGEQVVITGGVDPIACAGGPVGVTAIDTIVVNGTSGPVPSGGSLDYVNLRLDGGALGPGATDEGDGSSEIEVQLNFPNAGIIQVIGGQAADAVVAGATGGGLGLNLNADEATPDADVLFAAGAPYAVRLIARGGDDRLTATGGPGFTGPLTGTPTNSFDLYEVEGGGGDDLIVGSPEDDRLKGGTGADTVRAGGGADEVILWRDHAVDRARCGPGRDVVYKDPDDRTGGCER
jgi:RTX calcium-binding nonapeptide repeat (4 copies)